MHVPLASIYIVKTLPDWRMNEYVNKKGTSSVDCCLALPQFPLCYTVPSLDSNWQMLDQKKQKTLFIIGSPISSLILHPNSFRRLVTLGQFLSKTRWLLVWKGGKWPDLSLLCSLAATFLDMLVACVLFHLRCLSLFYLNSCFIGCFQHNWLWSCCAG